MNLGGQAVEPAHTSDCGASGKGGKAAADPPARPKAQVRERERERNDTILFTVPKCFSPERGGERERGAADLAFIRMYSQKQKR